MSGRLQESFSFTRMANVAGRILYNQLYEYLTANDILSKHQLGFRKFHSTASALLDCTNDWYINMDRKLFNLVVFYLYINDLPICLNKTKPRLFADDTDITAAGECLHDIEDAVNSDLENLRQWLMANKLSLNVAKTEFQIICTNQC